MCNRSDAGFFRPWHSPKEHHSGLEATEPDSENSSSSSGSSNGETKNSLEMLNSFVQDVRRIVLVEETSGPSSPSSCDALPVSLEPSCSFLPTPQNHLHPVPQDGFPAILPGASSSLSTFASNPYAIGSFYYQEAAELIRRQDMAAKQIKKLRPKKFKCEHCDVSFSNNGQLRGHVRIHTGERPFKCETEGCGKSFTRNEELTRHKRIHTGLRPHSCPVCGKSFGRKDHLKKHTRTHEAKEAYRIASAFEAFAHHRAMPVMYPLPPYAYTF
ncbi:Krueppel-like factor 15 [Prorops nasuta]|uniref:Krueppel-like factor 15 n=1 Tax=Prorops nasuta TaxID=863751 RepID=UPI0034CF63DC